MANGSIDPDCTVVGSTHLASQLDAEDGRNLGCLSGRLPVQSFQSLLGNLATYSRIQAASALNEDYVFTPYSRPTQTHRAPLNCSA